MKSTVLRDDTEILDQSHQMWAEGTSDIEPIEDDIKNLLLAEKWEATKIQIWFDWFQHFYRWNCKISKL